MKIPFVKAFRDIRKYKARSLFILFGVLIGLSAAGAVLSAYTILNREMDRNFMSTNPASIIIQSENFDKKAVQKIESEYPETEIEMRKTASVRIENRDGTYGIISLRAIEDFNNLRIDTFTLEKGQFPSKSDEILVEKDSFKILKNAKGNIGEKFRIKMPAGNEADFVLSGIVHAPGLAPASMENFSYAFVGLESMQAMGQSGWFDEMRIVSYVNRFDRQKMRELSDRIATNLRVSGYDVKKVDVPVPGRHPHANQLDSILFLLQSFTIITLLAGCLIIINLMNFIMSGQSKQIAIMKATGSNTLQIAIPYFLYVLVLSFLGIILSYPLSIAAGSAYSDFAAEILNFKIVSYSIPHQVLALQALIGIAAPMLAAAYPIYRNCAKSVKEGLYTVVSEPVRRERKLFGTNRSGKVHSSLLRIPITNLGRRRSRTILAILALAMGGVLFMASRNISVSVQNTVDQSFNAQKWDYDIRLAGVYPQEKLNGTLSGIEGLKDFEIWEGSIASFRKPEGRNSTSYQVRVMPGENPAEGILINKLLSEEEPWIKSGSTVEILVGDKSAVLTVAGIVNEVPAIAPAVLIGKGTFARHFGDGTKQSVLASADSREKADQKQILREIEKQFKEAGIDISENWTLFLLRKAFVDHLYVIINLLTIIVMLAVIVGGMSIASATGLSIAERKREIAVIRASGAGSMQILFMILSEAFLMGAAGWCMGVLASIPVSRLVGNYFGQIFLQVDLNNILSMSGTIQWLVLSVVLSLVSGLLPALKISGSSLKDMLAYE